MDDLALKLLVIVMEHVWTRLGNPNPQILIDFYFGLTCQFYPTLIWPIIVASFFVPKPTKLSALTKPATYDHRYRPIF